MIRLPEFTYHSPSSVEEAVAIKAEHGSDAMYVSGGTDLLPNMKRRQFEPRHLIGLIGLRELQSIHNGNGGTIGAGVPLSEIEKHPVIQSSYPSLARAASLISTPQLRHSGTIGGNLCLDTRCTYYNQSYAWRKALGFCLKKDGDTCWVAPGSLTCLAVSSSDCAPVVVALRGELNLAGPDRARSIPAETLYRNDGKDYLDKGANELLVSINLPDSTGWQSSYHKLRRRGTIDFPILGVAVAIHTKNGGICDDALIVLGAVASQPLIILEAAEHLIGERITKQLAAEAAQIAARHAKPLDNTDMSLSYRKRVAQVYIERAISEAAGIALDG